MFKRFVGHLAVAAATVCAAARQAPAPSFC